MSKRKKRRRSAAQGVIGFFRNVGIGDMGPVERTRSVASNLYHRYFGRRTVTCCGHYGDPGC
jgi:hypothetical protein